ncbi:formylmethanofuran dehydrogenase [Azohydromonas caseinilytica]|uniref:Formylmethanofuran dehydrogenase n=1 Tax=Azohydromonas caseinilytica TaxID=2728836 RepID=A0A848F9A8_9BURK|nr:formylmethanofuran dehydrogenase [Azohydromonas caseinilytica]NML15838.1 formylmethanofuran dehydrogenase [Azohydromonas caseinilytica]
MDDAPDVVADPAAGPWTCPFCTLLCDGFGVAAGPDGRLQLQGSDCPRAQRGLAQFAAQPGNAAPPLVNGTPATPEAAVAAAAQLLRRSRLPLFGGLGTDVAGARALYRLVERSGGVSDHMNGPALFTAARALQDRGGYTTTLAEVRNRADLIVCLTRPTENFPEFFRRCSVGDTSLVPNRRIVYLGLEPEAALQGLPGVTVDQLPLQNGDLFTTLSTLQALCADRVVPGAGQDLVDLAEALVAAQYTVLVWEPGRLGEHGALAAEVIHQIVNAINHVARAASLALGGNEGAGTVQQVFAWLSGLSTRTHCSPLGLEHDPLRHDARRLVAQQDVDALFWVNAFHAEPPPPTGLPLVLLGHPGTPPPPAGVDSVFIPVATPGIGQAGHLFRTDGTVLMPLRALRPDPLPGVAQVVAAISAEFEKA